MICPYCQTDNRDDREACYYCKKDLSMLRLIVNKAKHHYNQGLEFAERGRVDDAIGELKNALDLDGSMDNAHVVLGTLYAKKEMFAEARECWIRALAINHNLNRAHEYLHKAEKAEYVFPAIKRLKAISIGLGVGLAVALVLVLFFASLASIRKDGWERALKAVDPNLERVRSVAATLHKDLTDSKLGNSLAELQAVAGSKDASPISKEMAAALAARVTRDWQRRLDLASAANRANNTFAALQILNSIQAEQPSDEVRKSLERLSQTTQENALRWVNDSANFFFAGRLPYERFMFEARRFGELMKDTKARGEVQQLLTKAEKINEERQLNEALEAVASGPIVKAAETVAQWKAREPQYADALQKAMEQRLTTENTNALAEVRSLVEDKDFEKAAARIEELKLFYSSIRRPVPATLVGDLNAQIQNGRLRANYDAAMEAFLSKDWEKFIELSMDPKNLTANELEAAKLAAMHQEALDNMVRESLAWFHERDAAFKNFTINAEDAAQALRTYPVALRGIGNEDETLTTGTLLYFAAAAQAKLGRAGLALPMLDDVVTKYPKSSGARAATRLQKRLAEEAAKTNAPAPEAKEADQPAQTPDDKPAAAPAAKPVASEADAKPAKAAATKPDTTNATAKPAKPAAKPVASETDAKPAKPAAKPDAADAAAKPDEEAAAKPAAPEAQKAPPQESPAKVKPKMKRGPRSPLKLSD